MTLYASIVVRMDNLASLAHTTSAVPPAFNVDFYVTAATVIPVLFLVLAVQENTFKDMIQTWQDLVVASRTTLHHKLRPLTAFRFTARYSLLPLTTFGILIAGSFGELLAVYAVYQGQDRGSTRVTVLLSTMFLVIVVLARPAWLFVRACGVQWLYEPARRLPQSLPRWQP